MTHDDTKVADEGLHVTFTADAKINVRMDVVGFFADMTADDQHQFVEWTDPDGFWDGGRHTRPIDYLTWCLDNLTQVGTDLTPGTAGCVQDTSGLTDDWEAQPDQGRPWWERSHYARLLAAVPWLNDWDAAEAAREGLSEQERAAQAARIPGQNDVPLIPDTEEGN